jgi:hypothetical protein
METLRKNFSALYISYKPGLRVQKRNLLFRCVVGNSLTPIIPFIRLTCMLCRLLLTGLDGLSSKLRGLWISRYEVSTMTESPEYL